ncbi:hypothetical protein [Actinoplanes teichomyceticus]|uniref:Uncharacterized protein n=1 Tax=Actinoplanes teichomyceticus TaxID=1867 RepID=A0A561VSE9_ACTTI|nr:hypothetical protein [Actinoplanes teichomyceticus]TWG14523.1 hypothetical protein FHX34_104823 [Actinoplanes teichomyceticus]GIF16868.1 hypothetical protein Ate01nite_69000 [Actinoplanes teichomyceticus]
MTIVERLFALATAYAEAAVWADRERAFARSATTRAAQAAAPSNVEKADSAVEAARAALRADLHHALGLPVYAVPETKLPVCTWRQGQVLIRALAKTDERPVRVRYTPEQALATGAALIACAAVTDVRVGGTLSHLLGTFPSAEASGPATAGPDTPDAGRRA